MALLTFGTTPAKNATSVVTLNKADLLALPQVSGDAFWGASSGTNIKKVVVTFLSTIGGQDKRLEFDFAQASPTANLTFTNKARDNFEIYVVLVKDFDDGELLINRAQLLNAIPGLASLDIDLS